MSAAQGQVVPPPTDALAALDYIRGLQRNGRLLLSFVTLRPDRSPGVVAANAAIEAGRELVAAYALLTADASQIAADASQFATLLACVDDLSRRAAPATISTIRTTGAYRGVHLEAGPLPEELQLRATAVRRYLKRLLWFAGIVTALVVLLLVHVDDGRRAVQQLTSARADLAEVQERLTQQAASVWVMLVEPFPPPPPEPPLGSSLNVVRPPARKPSTAAMPTDATAMFTPFCPSRLDGTLLPGPHPKANSTEGARAATLCSQRDQAALRLDLVFQRVGAWNQRTRAAFMIPTGEWVCRRFYGRAACTTPSPRDTPLAVHWNRTEIRATGAISLLTGFVLPLLLGCLGGCASALRRLDQKLADWTLDAQDGRRAMLRIVLAAMMGGLVGVVFTGDGPIQVQGFALSLAAAAFFIGFSIEIVFTVVEAMVEAVAGRLKTQATAPSGAADATTRPPVTTRAPTLPPPPTPPSGPATGGPAPAQPPGPAAGGTTPAQPGGPATSTAPPAQPGGTITGGATPSRPGGTAPSSATPAQPGAPATGSTTPAPPGRPPAGGAQQGGAQQGGPAT